MKAVTREERRGAYPPVLVFCLLAAGIFTLAVGLLALLGWIFKLPLLASFGAGLIPMAPSSAVLFLFYGAVICLRAWRPLSRRVFQISLALVGLGTMVALWLFILGCLNIHLDIEHPGLNIIDTVGKTPIGYMSPVTAFGFLLASLSFLASLTPSAIRLWRTGLALGAAGLLAGTNFIFLLAYIYGTPLLYGGTFLPPALNSVLTFVVLGLALLALAGRMAGRSGGLPGDGSRMAFFLALIFVLLAAGIVTVGYRYYQHYEQHFRAEAERELSAIAELKVNELAQYRKERQWDAGAFFQNPAFSSLVRRFLEHPEDAEALPQLQEWAAKYLVTGQYDLVCLFDVQSVIRMAVPVEPAISSFVSQNISEILRSGRVIFQDFTKSNQDQRAYLALLVPIFDESDANRPLGVLALQIDPETYLYPFIQRWPTPSRTGETLLVRRDGNDALFLNDLKFGTNTALKLHVSLAQTNMPAVEAILGQEGVVEGTDYRGVPTLAALQAIPDSPWFMVSKMDTAEVYAPLRERLRLTILLVVLLLASTSLGIGAIWRQQRIRYYQERYQIAEALRESEERFRRVFEEGPTGMVMLDETFRFIRANPAFTAMLGYSEAELQKMTFPDITHSNHVQQDVEQVRRLLRGELAVYRTEKQYVAKSGKALWGQVQVNVVRNADGTFRYILAIITDIAARKQAEEELLRSESKFRTLYDSTSDAVMLLDENGFSDCNQATLAVYGCASREEFCSKHPADVSPPVQPDGSDSRTLANQRIVTALENGTNHFEWIHKRVDTGEPFTADVLLNAMELDGRPVLQAVVRDITARKRAEEAVRASETRYRRLFEAARDGILILDAATGRVVDANPFLTEILGYSHKEFLGKTVWELGFFKDIVANQAKFEELQKKEYIRYEDLPLKTSDGRRIHVEFVSNVYLVNQHKVIQCNIRDITERKQAEESLHYEQALMGTLMDNLPDAIYFKDVASRFLRVNRAHSRKFGLSDPAQIVGKSDTDFFTREHSRQALADEQEIVRTGQPLMNIEEKETWMDGTVSWVLTTKLPLRDGTGRIIGTCGISRDITERKRAEEALRESRALYLSLVEQLPVGVFRKDREGRYVLVNPFFCWLKGMKPENFLGKSPSEVAAVELAKQGEMGLATKYAANGEEHHEQILRTGKPVDQVEEYVRTDGTKLFLHVIKLPVLGPDGKIIGTQGIQFDITDIKEAEETIAHERQLLRTLIDLLPETFSIKDLDSRLLVANEALARQWGKENPSQLLGLSDADLFPAGLAALYRDEDRKVFAGEPLMGREGVCIYADGREHTVLTTKVPYRDGQGRICGLVGFGFDITERKLAQQRIADELNFNQTVLRASPVGILVFQASGPCVSANKTTAQIVGGSREELLRQNFHQLKSWKDSGMLATAEAALAAQAERNLETEMATTFGRQVWVSCRFAPFQYNGELHLLLIISDITERKRASDEIARTAKEWQATFDATKDAIWILDSNSRVLRSNKTAEGYFKRTCCEMMGKPCWEIVHGTAEPIPECPFVRARQSGHRETMDLQRGDRWFEVIVDPILDAAGQFAGVVHIVSDITERKRAEDALRRSEEMLKRSQRVARVGHYSLDVASGDWTSSEVLDDIFGIDAGFKRDVAGWAKLIHPEDRDAMLAHLQDHVLKQRHPFDKEYRIVRANDGNILWVRGIGELRFNASGGIVEMFGTIQDITESKRTEESLQQANRTLRVLSESDHALVHAEDETELMRQVCRAVVELGGFRMAWVGLAKSDERRTVWPMAVAGYDEGYVQALNVSWGDNERGRGPTGTAIRTGQTVVNPDSSTNPQMAAWREAALRRGYVASIALPLRVEESVLGALTIYADKPGAFGEREVKLLEDLAGDLAFGLRTLRERQALRAREVELRAILESTGDGILAVDRDGEKVIKTNQRYAELWRIPQSVLDTGDNNKIRSFVLNQLTDPDAFLKRVHELYGSDAPAVDTLFFKDGRILERHGFPMMLAGAVMGRVWSFRDITERKRQEQELAEKNLELERFTYTVSHDLKSPLVTVKTFLGYLEQDLLNPDAERVKQDVGYMRGAADKMGHLLDELLNLARVGRKMNPPVRITFQQVAREAVGLVAGRISTSRAEVVVAEAAVVLEGDRPRLVEIWQNLVENACKFMGDQPKPRVEIGVEQRGAETVFFVRDNGAGIEPRYQEKVFSLFEKLNPKIEGTGMGLALVKRVVELYKGRIWVESGGLGQGANFLFTLPGAIIVEAETGQSS